MKSGIYSFFKFKSPSFFCGGKQLITTTIHALIRKQHRRHNSQEYIKQKTLQK